MAGLKVEAEQEGCWEAELLVSDAELKPHAVRGPICRVKWVEILERTLKGPVHGEARGEATAPCRTKTLEAVCRKAGLDSSGGGGAGM